jgi:phosphoglycerate kinase
MGLDIGPKTRAAFRAKILAARTVVWNGPMGVFEMPAFRAGTEAVGHAVAECKGYTVVGGGDSVAAIELLGLASEIDHISTGGGASLELLEGQALPGIEVLGRRRKA